MQGGLKGKLQRGWMFIVLLNFSVIGIMRLSITQFFIWGQENSPNAKHYCEETPVSSPVTKMGHLFKISYQLPCFISHFTDLIFKGQGSAWSTVCGFELCVFEHCVHLCCVCAVCCVCVCLRCVLAVSLYLTPHCHLFCSSWVWPSPWRCFIRSTEQGRSTMPSRARVQTEAYGTDCERKAPLHPLHLLT